MQQTRSIGITSREREVKAVNVAVKSEAVSDFWQQVEFNRFGIIAMLLVIVTCLGGVAAAVAIQTSAFLLGVVALPAMAVEAFILSVMPMRTILITSVISVIVSLAVAIFF